MPLVNGYAVATAVPAESGGNGSQPARLHKRTDHATSPECYAQGAHPATHRRSDNYTLLLTE